MTRRGDIDDRIRDAVHLLANLSDEPPPFPGDQLDARLVRDGERSPFVSEPSRSRSTIRLIPVAGLVVVIIASALAWQLARPDEQVPRASTPLSVQHEVVEYSQRADIVCPSGSLSIVGMFDEMTFEVWGSEAVKRWRQTVMYPDGSSRDLVLAENFVYPTASYARGTQQGRTYICEGMGVLLAEPGQGSLASLNPLGAVPRAPGGGPALQTYRDSSEQVPGEFVDSRGRAAQLWRQVINGFSVIGTEQRPLRQTDEFFVDPKTGRVLERRFEQSYEGLGSVSWSATLRERGRVSFPGKLFDLSGYRDTTEAANPSSLIPLNDKDRITPVTELGEDWIWPAQPRAESATSVARRFAAEVLGWTDVTVTTDGTLDDAGPIGVTGVRFTTRDGRTLFILTIRTSDGDRVVHQVGQSSGSLNIGPGPTARLNFPMVENAKSADVLVSTKVSTLAWRARLSDYPRLIVPDIEPGQILSVLVLYRDARNRVITANVYSTASPFVENGESK